MRLESAALVVGEGMGPTDFLELETCQLGAYKVGNGAGIDTRPEGALPMNFGLGGWEGVTYSHTRSASSRRLSTALVTFDTVREAHRCG